MSDTVYFLCIGFLVGVATTIMIEDLYKISGKKETKNK